MAKFFGDHKMTAAVTVSKRHRGEVPLSVHEQAKRALDREAHDARLDGNRWGQVLKLLIGKRDELRWATDPDSLFPARNDEACVDVVKRAASALGPSINEAMRMQREADDRAETAERQLISLEAESRQGLPGPTNIEMSETLHAAKDEQRKAIERDGCCGGTPMADGVCFGIGVCPRVTEIQSCSRFCERLIDWTNQLSQPENLE